MTSPYIGKKIIAVFPQDRTVLRELEDTAMIPDALRWKPSIEHAPTTCENCGRNCWIGPKQKAVDELVFVATVRLCVSCMLALGLLSREFDTVALNPDEDKIPRRT